MLKALTIGNEEYDVVPDEARILTETLIRTFERSGIPGDLKETEMNETAWGFVDIIYRMWKNSFPIEYRSWADGVEQYLIYELPVEQAVKQSGGYFPISYPMRFYNLLHTFFPNLKVQNKHFIMHFLKRHPEFKVTNYTYG